MYFLEHLIDSKSAHRSNFPVYSNCVKQRGHFALSLAPFTKLCGSGGKCSCRTKHGVSFNKLQVLTPWSWKLKVSVSVSSFTETLPKHKCQNDFINWNHSAWHPDFAMIYKNEVFLKFLSAQVSKRPLHHDSAGNQCKVKFTLKIKWVIPKQKVWKKNNIFIKKVNQWLVNPPNTSFLKSQIVWPKLNEDIMQTEKCPHKNELWNLSKFFYIFLQLINKKFMPLVFSCLCAKECILMRFFWLKETIKKKT